MITRVEIDGFKSFLDFTLDVPPFLALVGPNASGKSNLFDAIEYGLDLWLAGSEDLMASRRGRPQEQFHRVTEGEHLDHLLLALHWLIRPSSGFVAFGELFEVELDGGSPRVANSNLVLNPLAELAGGSATPLWDRRWRGLDDFIAEEPDRLAQSLVFNAPAVQKYVPDPPAMRSLALEADRRPLQADGRNLAAVLGRMSSSTALDELMIDLAALIPDAQEVKTELDQKRHEWSFDLVIEGQGAVPSSLLSDGTLRILGLLAALHDPDHSGVLMVEEIENGLHPGRLAELLRRIQERVTDLNDPESLDRPLRQVIITSHSPVVVSELYRTRPESLVFMDTAVRVDPDKERVSRVTVAKPVRDEGEPGTFVSPRQVRKYLGTVRQDEL